jgi:pimeloyl-ACP methyl ester carboxylesterase
MQDGAYVHYAWWNNLCREYMAGPLHNRNAHPGVLGFGGIVNGAVNPDAKALPVDDYQFQADAELFLRAIRANNPSAMIIVLGHSMGGAAVTRLGTDTEVVIDILAPLDPVENRSTPWIPWTPTPGNDWHNFTRLRIAHVELDSLPPPDPARRQIGRNVINLFHRYQKEATFPMDYYNTCHFLHDVPPGGTSTQLAVATCASPSVNCYYPGECCTLDGHGEIVGFRGLRDWQSFPLALEAQDWPTSVEGDDPCKRRRLLIEMPYADFDNQWRHRPVDPDLCLVSGSLINLYENMNRPPVADAGGDRTVAYAAAGVLLDGSASSDPDDDDLSYAWQGEGWEAVDSIATVQLGIGMHVITLTVRDPSGHIDRDTIELTVSDGTIDSPEPVTSMISAHPNPFNASTTVVFELAERQHVSLQVFDLKGRLVRTLEDRTFEPGRHERRWDGRSYAGTIVASGTYFVRVRAGNRNEYSKILLLK